MVESFISNVLSISQSVVKRLAPLLIDKESAFNVLKETLPVVSVASVADIVPFQLEPVDTPTPKPPLRSCPRL